MEETMEGDCEGNNSLSEYSDSLMEDNLGGSGVHPALLNPVILDIIFGFRTISGLKRCRRVCRTWEKVATPILAKRTYFSVNNYCIESKSTEKPILLRRITCESDNFGSETNEHDFFAFANQRGESVHELKLYANSDFLSSFTGSLSTRNRFPNLKKIVICERDFEFDESVDFSTPRFDPLLSNELANMSNIRCIETHVEEMSRSRDVYHANVQKLIRMSPNLEVLKITDHFYPDLTTCGKLKTLEWTGNPISLKDDIFGNDDLVEVGIEDNFSLAKFFKMTEQVKNSLQKLVISSSTDLFISMELPTIEVEDHSFSFPYFPNLTEFCFDSVNLYEIKFEHATQKQLPSLRKLRLCENDHGMRKFLDGTIFNISTCWRSVESLSLGQLFYDESDYSAQLFPKIGQIFPNLIHLDVTICNGSGAGTQLLDSCLVSLSKCFKKLENLTIRLDWQITLPELIYVTSLPFSGLKTLKLVNCNFNQASVKDEGYGKLCNGLSPVIPNITLQGFVYEFSGSSLPKMHKWIEEHKGNIIFLH
ncbi:hypothetical protein Fcan01_01480 [Folsomia candida]|uniref:F-box domain-containing protein n=2 Tax=Folsomia candida TaxID=158441 RepID=A0A226F2V2_FOLCA|nr:hypothetical protein Fcan01_01480 [Folsomia candida]